MNKRKSRAPTSAAKKAILPTKLDSTTGETSLGQSERSSYSEPGTVTSDDKNKRAASAWEDVIAQMEQVLGEKMSPLIKASRVAFQRDLPALLKERYYQWVAYSGDQQLGFSSSKTKLYQECLKRGLKPSEFLVLSIEPEVNRDVDLLRD